jgi:hypothetical protein
MLIMNMYDVWYNLPLRLQIFWIPLIIGILDWFFRLLNEFIFVITGARNKRLQWLRISLENIIVWLLKYIRYTLRFGRSYWLSKRCKITHYFFITADDNWWYEVRLENNDRLVIEWNGRFRTLQNAKDNIHYLFWRMTVIYEKLDDNWIYSIAIHSNKINLDYLNEVAEKSDWWIFYNDFKNSVYLTLPKEN